MTVPDLSLDWRTILDTAPTDWQRTKLGSVFRERKESGRTDLPLLSVTASGLVHQPETGRRDISRGDKSGYKRVAVGDIAYNTMRMWQGVSVRCDKDGIVSPAYTVAVALQDIDPVFASYMFKFPPVVRRFRAYSQGMVSDTSNLKYPLFAEIDVVLPPLPEQRKIAAILSSVDDAIQATQAVIEQTKKVKQGLLQELLTKGIGHARFKQTPVGEVPEEWDVTPLLQCATVRSGIAKNAKRQLREPVDVPYLRVANVQEGHIDLSEVKTLRIERDEVDRYRLQSGDVLLTEGGDIDKLGRGDVWLGLIDPCVHQNHIFSVRCRPSVLDPRFLAGLVTSPYGKSYFLNSGKQTTNLASINKTQLRRFPVLLAPLDEQRAINRRLESTDQVADASQVEASLLSAVKAGLLQDLLTGKIRVRP